MANNIYGAISITGGAGSGSLKDIAGTALADKDIALVAIQDGGVYFYTLDADSAASESVPNIVEPTTDGGNKRWILTKTVGSIHTLNTISSTPVSLTATQCMSVSHFVTNAAATEVDLPAVSGVTDGAFFVIYMTTAYVLTIDPNASDRIRLNGVALSDGVSIVTDGTAGNYVVLQKDSSDGWTVVGRSGYISAGS